MAVNLNALNISLIEDVRIQAFFTTKLPLLKKTITTYIAAF